MPLSDEVIVENGGDIFMHVKRPATVSLNGGALPSEPQSGLKNQARSANLGKMTSSGTVGPSLSLGRADAACVVAADTALADACATALGNRVPEAAAINAALAWLAGIPGLHGAVVVVGEHLGAWGDIELVPL